MGSVIAGLGLLVVMACMFTLGMWTPGPLMPEPIRVVSALTPMGAITQALTGAWYSGSGSLTPFLVMALWALITAVGAVKVFRWT
ncbi:hypothetical protein [Microbacterium lushaniae]|uniref:Uncharacterized protein n=1 Tax=Microbacterium lushaniae TaxID=2614639 RepID=A0A5J6L7F4_9MICO|nr:hypothetical protein [Microbacterium lushaniae]QEW04330.1 hypothetical protein F6J85_15360 [Microbacterium lushaniae]